MQVTAQRKTVVDIDTRRTVYMAAAARKPVDVVKENHEQFVRHMLKARMGWGRLEAAPQAIKDTAKAIAAQLIARDQTQRDALVAKKAQAEALTNVAD